ncbi:hypothetical protein, partial [Salmonella sp. s55004]|uniref:hypothetical protein n=1 Tax=Salmonella sp. s55004 TaxID=3159675 RepID=UPI0039803DEB
RCSPVKDINIGCHVAIARWIKNSLRILLRMVWDCPYSIVNKVWSLTQQRGLQTIFTQNGKVYV